MKRILMATAMAMLLAGGTAFAEGDSSTHQPAQGGSGSLGESSDESSVGGSGSMGSTSSEKSSKGGSGAMSGSAQSAAKQGTLTVKEVDQANNKLTFEAQVSPNAKIMSSSGQKLSLDQIKEGDQVRANFDPKTGNLQKVTVQSQESGQGGTGSESQPKSKSDSSSEDSSKQY